MRVSILMRLPSGNGYGRMADVTKVVIIGGGPGGYEAALVANQLGGDVTLVERDGLGGAVLRDEHLAEDVHVVGVVLGDGRIVEQERHDELLSREGAFARMWQTYTATGELEAAR